MKVTRGKWVYDPHHPYGVYSEDVTGSIIGTTDGFEYAERSHVEKAANAHLMALSKRLFQGLEMLIKQYPGVLENHLKAVDCFQLMELYDEAVRGPRADENMEERRDLLTKEKADLEAAMPAVNQRIRSLIKLRVLAIERELEKFLPAPEPKAPPNAPA